jgi:hypothetical protein
MGDRSHIVVRETASQTEGLVILYGHWAGDDNLTAVETVLKRTDRIGDPVYLTAQVFHEFISQSGRPYDGLGFGLYVGTLDEIDETDNPAAILDADTGAVTYRGETYQVKGNPLFYADTPNPEYEAGLHNVFCFAGYTGMTDKTKAAYRCECHLSNS